jgi:hypothetical protein
MTFPNDRETLAAAFRALKKSPEESRWMAIANTLDLSLLWVGEALWEEARTWPGVEAVGELEPVSFTEDGDLVWPGNSKGGEDA